MIAAEVRRRIAARKTSAAKALAVILELTVRLSGGQVPRSAIVRIWLSKLAITNGKLGQCEHAAVSVAAE